MQLKAIVNKRAKDIGISAQLVLQNYVLERLLERMSFSRFKESFIIKGGFLLQAVIGLHSRATMDLDTTVRGFDLNKETLWDILRKITFPDTCKGKSSGCVSYFKSDLERSELCHVVSSSSFSRAA